MERLFKKCSLRFIIGNGLSSQQIAQGRTNLRGMPCLSIGDVCWRDTVQLTVQCRGATAGSLRQITAVGGLGHIENNTGLMRGFAVYTPNRAFCYSKHAVIREAAPDDMMGALRIQYERSLVKIKGAERTPRVSVSSSECKMEPLP